MINSGTPATMMQSTWRTSSRCKDGADYCIAVASLAGGNDGLRDTKDGDSGPVLVFPAGLISAFAAAIKAGRFDQI